MKLGADMRMMAQDFFPKVRVFNFCVYIWLSYDHLGIFFLPKTIYVYIQGRGERVRDAVKNFFRPPPPLSKGGQGKIYMLNRKD
jgi:hypothetical protein